MTQFVSLGAEGKFSCAHFCMGNLETEGELCPTESLPGGSDSSSSGVRTFLHLLFLSSIFASSILSSITCFSCWTPVLFPVAPGTCIACHFCSRLIRFLSTSTLMPRPPGVQFLPSGGSGSLSSSGWSSLPPGQALFHHGPGTALQWWLRTSSPGSTG